METVLPKNPNLDLQFDHANICEIYLAGGCFWGVDAYIRRIPGVYQTTVGYANGITENPTYEEVCTGTTKHAETVHVLYDSSHISLQELLKAFFEIIDPTSRNKQGGDSGLQYRTGIYYTNESDTTIIETCIQDEQTKYAKPIVTEHLPLQQYFLAENYHQDYLEKNPAGYCHVRFDTLPTH